MTEIRLVEAHAVAAIMPVMQAAFDPAHGEAWTLPQCRDALAVPGTVLLAAGPEHAPQGFALARTIFDTTELMLLAVMPNVQRQGHGTALVQALVSQAKATGSKSIFVEVRAENSARRFYTELGFADIGWRKNYYRIGNGQYSDAVTMALKLS